MYESGPGGEGRIEWEKRSVRKSGMDRGQIPAAHHGLSIRGGTPRSTGQVNSRILRDKISSSIILTCHQHFSPSIFLYINHFICQEQ